MEVLRKSISKMFCIKDIDLKVFLECFMDLNAYLANKACLDHTYSAQFLENCQAVSPLYKTTTLPVYGIWELNINLLQSQFSGN